MQDKDSAKINTVSSKIIDIFAKILESTNRQNADIMLAMTWGQVDSQKVV